MRHVDEYRDPVRARTLIEAIRRRATRRHVIMEVCGGQTHSLLRHGLDDALSDGVELLHGPGCPVCVTPAETIDQAARLSRAEGTILTSFGDMLRVPGTRGSLLQARAAGGDVRAVYSPLDAVELAAREPHQRVVFLAVGFETTAPATALAVLQADRLRLANFRLLCAHVRVQPAMQAILADPDNRVASFLAAGHVCAVTGSAGYAELARSRRVPIVVTGFEPVDLLEGILECVTQLEEGRAEVVNRYSRVASAEGNAGARAIVDRVYEPCDAPWRGLGTLRAGGLALRPEWKRFDVWSDTSFNQRDEIDSRVPQTAPNDTVECRAGEVLSGRLRPCDCPQFARGCTPESPLGAPMVSSEGACAAYFRFRRRPS